MLTGKTSRKGEMNIYTRIRKVINFDKKRKNWKKKFLGVLTIPDILPFPLPLHPFLKILYFLCYVIIYNISKSCYFSYEISLHICYVITKCWHPLTPYKSATYMYISFVCYFIVSMKIIAFSYNMIT